MLPSRRTTYDLEQSSGISNMLNFNSIRELGFPSMIHTHVDAPEVRGLTSCPLVPLNFC